VSKIVGLTGNIACGKTLVASHFLGNDIPVIDADNISRQVVQPGNDGLIQVIKCFGKQFLCLDGTLDRKKLGDLVFSDKKALKDLNDITHPLINSQIEMKVRELSKLNKIIVVDASLIIENNNQDRYDALILVYCSEKKQLERLMKRNGFPKEKANARIASQMSYELKKKYADYLIDNSFDKQLLKSQTLDIIRELKNVYY
jgi:dephospho-CoA kinase